MSRDDEFLDKLLGALQQYTGATPGEFFGALAGVLESARRWQPPGLMHEFRQLSGIGGEQEPHPGAEFLFLPAADIRLQFCNLLTGFCLSGYGQWINRVMVPEQGASLCSHFRNRLLDTLHGLIHLPVPAEGPPGCGPAIAARVKTALCILFRKLQRREGFQFAPLYRNFSPREYVQSLIAGNETGEPGMAQLLYLFDALTGGDPPARAEMAGQNPTVPALLPAREIYEREMTWMMNQLFRCAGAECEYGGFSFQAEPKTATAAGAARPEDWHRGGAGPAGGQQNHPVAVPPERRPAL